MTKLMLAGAAALALSTGAAFAATAQPAADYGNAPAQYSQQNQHYAYMSGQQNSALGYTVQPNAPQSSQSWSEFGGPTAFGGGGNG